MRAPDLDIGLSDVMVPYIPPLSADVVNLPVQEVLYESGSVCSTHCPWFLRDETWVVQHGHDESICVEAMDLRSLIRAVEDMLLCWAMGGHNSFIHRRLYEKGMPKCVQDAFTTLASYAGRTPAVTETILQIADERSSELERQPEPAKSGPDGIREHLARVHALFVYEFIRLFDGSVRLRASAEQQIPTLRRWVVQMCEAAKQCRAKDELDHRPQYWTASVSEREYQTSADMWRLWILTESVRRTQLVIDTIANTYETMSKGWAQCTGAVMFTARRGLWEADSAVKWFDMCCEKPPLLVPPLRPGSLISQYPADEFDDFATLMWRFIVGPDRIQSWIDKGGKTAQYSSS